MYETVCIGTVSQKCSCYEVVSPRVCVPKTSEVVEAIEKIDQGLIALEIELQDIEATDA